MNGRCVRSSVAAALAIGAALLLVTSASSRTAAQGSSVATPRAPSGKPDLSGVWTRPSAARGNASGGTLVASDEKGNFTSTIKTRRCAPYQKDCYDNTNQALDDLFRDRIDRNRPLYKPEYWDKVQDADYNTNTRDPIFHCEPLGVPRIGPPNQIVQTANQVVFLYAIPLRIHDYRVIPTDGRAHNPDRFPTYNGDAVGHWEGDTLVIDIVGFVDTSWLAGGNFPGIGGGYIHSYDLHVTERLRREGNTLHYQATVEDPTMLLAPWVMNPADLKLNADPNFSLEEGLPCKDFDSAINGGSKIRH